MRKLLLFLVLVLLLVGGFYTWKWMNRPAVGSIGLDESIIFFGDSLVYGVGATKGNDMPSLLSKKFNREFMNKGVPGDTTKDGLERLERDVLQHNPGLVLLLLGGNDVLQKIDQEETFTNLGIIIDRIQAQGGQVILIGVRGGLLLDSYDDNYMRLAWEKKIVHVPDILDGIFTDPSLKADRVHPNDDGYQKMFERLEPAVLLFLE